MELLYNPDRMPKQEIKDTFVGRQDLLDKLVATVERQSVGAGVQHIVLVAPRGMGKTTLLIMLELAVREGKLSENWLAVRFPEEMYSVTSLADFWIETLDAVARVTQNRELAEKTKQLQARYPDDDSLQEAALSLLRSWRRENNRRLLLLVDNFQAILAQIGDEQRQAALRSVLMNEDLLMIVGAAPSFFVEAENYDAPLYNFFKIEHMRPLSFDEIVDLLRRRAQADGIADFEERIVSNRARLRVLEYFTGGNARLVLMMYQVVARAEVIEAKESLQKLLDSVTPFFKARTEDLAPQQRKVLDYIARRAGATSEGVSPSDIAAATRLKPAIVSVQLRRMADDGYVHQASLRGRTSTYMLTEKLYSLWYQMRFGRDAIEKMRWLVDFLSAFYSADDLIDQCRQMGSRFQDEYAAGQTRTAMNLLECRVWMLLAIDGHEESQSVLTGILNDCGVAENSEMLSTIDSRYGDTGHVPKELRELLDLVRSLPQAAQGLSMKISSAIARGDWNEVLNLSDQFALATSPNAARWLRAACFLELGRTEEALQDIDALEPDAPVDFAAVWLMRGAACMRLQRFSDAIESFDKLIAMEGGWSHDADVLNMRGLALMAAETYDEALASIDRSIAIRSDDAARWFHRALCLAHLGNFGEAAESCKRSLSIKPDRWQALVMLGSFQLSTGDLESAVSSFVAARAVGVEADDFDASSVDMNLCVAYVLLGRQDEAVVLLKRILADESPDEPAVDVLWLLTFAASKQPAKVRDVIIAAGAAERYFPLARAIEFLETGDPALIEKLAPEMRPIVEQVVDRLRSAGLRRSQDGGSAD